MPSQAKLVLHKPEVCLVSSLADVLSKSSSKDLSRTLILLPTQRLGTHLIARLARHWAAFIPPKISSLEAIIQQARPTTHGSVVSETSLEFIIQRTLHRETYKYLQPGHERELRLILGELYDNDCRDDGFEKGRNFIRQDIYRDPNYIDSLIYRLDEIEDVLLKVESYLEAQGRLCQGKRVAMASCCQGAIHQQLSQYEKIYLVAYTSVAPSWLPALKVVCQQANTEIWLSKKPDIYHRSSPLDLLCQHVENFLDDHKTCQADGISYPQEQAELLEVDTPFAELATVVQLISDLVAQGHESSQIGVLLTNEGIYGPLFSRLQEASFAGANLAMTSRLSNTELGRWLQRMMHCVEDPSLENWLDWMRDPYTTSWLLEQHEISMEALTWNLARSNAPTLEHFLRGDGESEELLVSLQELSRDFASGDHPLDHWVTTLFRWFNRCFGEKLTKLDKPSLLDAVSSFERALEDIGSLRSELLNRRDFFDFIDRFLLAAEVRVTGEPLQGVQVINLAESRYYPFSAVIILGCNEGTFPKGLPKDELLDNTLKKEMGLPGWDSLEAMEDQTFHLLKARIPKLYLLRSKYVAGQPTVRSRFIERLQAENRLALHKLPFQPEDFWQTIGKPTPESVLTPYHEGLVAVEPDSLWTKMSASSLEKLIRCPYRFLLSKAQIQPLDFFRRDDPRAEGEWLHKVLEVFFRGTYDEAELFSWHGVARDDFRSIALSRLERLTIMIGPAGIQSKPVYFHLIQHSWPAFVDHIDRFFGETLVTLSRGMKEASLGTMSRRRQTLKIRNLVRDCQGSIDSIDFSYGLTMLTDYKRKGNPTRRETQLGISPQLAFYALVVQGYHRDLDIKQMIVGYWNIIKGEWSTHGVGDECRDKAQERGLANQRSPSLPQILDATVRTWTWREKQVLDQERFYADPSCCGMCEYQDICRKDDPRYRVQLEDQADLNEFVSGEQQ
ncbi:PD-(D/E)XK nuclease family protein [Pseudobacteriovorax antillogorgiicola]|uniref:Exodeoxyribonuclease V, gamma subunit n=1 Tax=Pseudobacteriovorax antillogorgiicola TaxID=1513793 RepID=A0A1Y6CN88_9BACT|nr:PD-(D/E)XK nuclease family protein [Pseudobacteriovorax antillogorgiicola]TCS45033.1 exodeoxyribonuclease V gamma subunit [Pseudobacteriovorax antillogorgiicola]SMF76153.1 Exodeoxyribonuclease V, gamma subunit [Pseudobacteriovorax antillogorgiicola]